MSADLADSGWRPSGKQLGSETIRQCHPNGEWRGEEVEADGGVSLPLVTASDRKQVLIWLDPNKYSEFLPNLADLKALSCCCVEYPPEHGRGYLKTLAALPADNHIPVALGWVRKASMPPQFHPTTATDRNTLFHTMAFIGAVAGIERFMRMRHPNENCQIVAEDHPNARRFIRGAHNFLRTPESAATLPPELAGLFPLQRVINTVFFAEKSESAPLQLADACAYISLRHFEGRPDSAEYFSLLEPALLNIPAEFWAGPSEI